MTEDGDLFLTLKDDYQEALEQLNEALLRLENDPEDREALESASRQLHNIKGFAGRMQAPRLGQVAHSLEDVLAAVIRESSPFDQKIADLLFQGIDIFVHYLREREVPAERTAQLIQETESRLFGHGEEDSPEDHLESLLSDFIAAARDNVTAINEGLFNLEAEPMNKEILQDVYRNAHSLKGSALTMGFERMGRIAHRMEDLLRAFQKGSLPVTSEACDVLFDANDAVSIMLDTLAAGKRMKVNVEDTMRRLGKFLPELEAEGKTAVDAARKPPAKIAPTAAAGPTLDTVRVPTAKLDDLVNLSGEAVIAQVRLASEVDTLGQIRQRWNRLRLRGGSSGPNLEATGSGEQSLIGELLALGNALEQTSRRLQEAAENSGRLIESLQHRTMEIRMLPLSHVFNTLPRVVRDLGRQFGKQVNLVMEGGETTIDKRILEQLGDPLIHLLRNALDHGIETPDRRRQRGKPETGTIRLGARQEGSKVVITMEDDGAGIDPRQVREQAVRKGFLDEGASQNLTDAQILDLIFLSGFSTSSLVTDVSGRGVGMDVVRTNVEKLKGQVQVSSEAGKGSHFVVTLPLTLATIHALMIKCAGEILAIPTYSVARTIRVARDAIVPIQGGRAILDQDEIIPVRNLDAVLGWQSEGGAQRNGRPVIVVLQVSERKSGFVVDDIVGEREIVTKDLGSHLQNVQYVSWATILGSGEVALILDTPQLLWQEQPEVAASWAEEGSKSRWDRRRVILVVEDQVVTRQMEKSILEAAGYEVVTAEHGVDALDKLNRHEVDLVVTDIQMPKMDGFRLTEKIRSGERTRDLPVIVVTSMDREDDRRRGLEAGADAYLVKSSFDQENLIDTIEILLGQRGEERQ